MFYRFDPEGVRSETATGLIYVLVRYWASLRDHNQAKPPHLIESFRFSSNRLGLDTVIDEDDDEQKAERAERAAAEIKRTLEAHWDVAAFSGKEGDHSSRPFPEQAATINGRLVRRKGAFIPNATKVDDIDSHTLLRRPEILDLKDKGHNRPGARPPKPRPEVLD